MLVIPNLEIQGRLSKRSVKTLASTPDDGGQEEVKMFLFAQHVSPPVAMVTCGYYDN